MVDGSTSRSRDESPFPSWVLSNAGLVAAIAVPLFVGFRVLTISRFDTVTALAVIQSAGVASVTLGVIVVLFPVLVVMAALGAVVFAANKPRQITTWLVALGLSIFAVLFVSPTLAVGALMGSAGAMVSGALRKSHPRDERVRSVEIKAAGRVVERVAGVGLIFYVLLNVQPWLPPEEVETETGDRLVGFVLRDGARPAVLTYDDRLVVYLPSEIADRRLCRGTSLLGSTNSIWNRLRDRSEYVRCSRGGGASG